MRIWFLALCRTDVADRVSLGSEWTDQPIGRSIPVDLSPELSGVNNAQLLLLDAEGERLASCALPGAS